MNFVSFFRHLNALSQFLPSWCIFVISLYRKSQLLGLSLVSGVKG